jgi:predicted transcriptional regulator
MKTQSPSISRRQVLDAISDNESLELFHAIATNVNDVELKMTRKQYYVRLNRLMEAGIIKKRNNTYCPTSFGKVVFEIQLILKGVVEARSRFKPSSSLD